MRAPFAKIIPKGPHRRLCLRSDPNWHARKLSVCHPDITQTTCCVARSICAYDESESSLLLAAAARYLWSGTAPGRVLPPGHASTTSLSGSQLAFTNDHRSTGPLGSLLDSFSRVGVVSKSEQLGTRTDLPMAFRP